MPMDTPCGQCHSKDGDFSGSFVPHTWGASQPLCVDCHNACLCGDDDCPECGAE